jgi:hypothetical protein
MKNQYEVRGDTTAIYCESPEGLVEVYIDTEDLPLLLEKNWTWRCYYKTSNHMYCYGAQNTALHRFLMKPPKGAIVDHEDRNPLNNRRNKLSVVSSSESNRNRSVFKNNTSGYPGVTLNRKSGKWKSVLRINGKEMFLGYFEDVNDAIAIRKEAEAEYWGK